MNKKEKQLAIKSALSSKVAENKLVVVDEFKLDELRQLSLQKFEQLKSS